MHSLDVKQLTAGDVVGKQTGQNGDNIDFNKMGKQASEHDQKANTYGFVLLNLVIL